MVPFNVFAMRDYCSSCDRYRRRRFQQTVIPCHYCHSTRCENCVIDACRNCGWPYCRNCGLAGSQCISSIRSTSCPCCWSKDACGECASWKVIGSRIEKSRLPNGLQVVTPRPIYGWCCHNFMPMTPPLDHGEILPCAADHGESVLHSLILPSLAAMMTLQVLVGVATRSETLPCGCIL